jgi:hypothetical protein
MVRAGGSDLAGRSFVNRARASWQRTAVLASVVALIVVQIRPAEATNIGIDLGPPGRLSQDTRISFSDLNGIALAGQTLSLDFLFRNGEFGRLFTSTKESFEISVTLQTLPPGGSGFAGFPSGMGNLVDRHFHPLQPAQDLGRSAGDDGSLTVGLFSLKDEGLHRPLDFFGVHFDLTLPENASFSVMDAEFRLVTSGIGRDDVFGIGPGVPRDIVPELGSTLLLLGIALIGLTGLRKTARF